MWAAVLYLVAIGTLGAVIWRECAKADAAEAELERRIAAAEAEAARRKMSGPGVSIRGPRHIP